MRSIDAKLALLLLLVELSIPAIAQAEASDEQAARIHDQRAREHYDSGDWAAALREMELAQEALPSSPRLYNMANCHERLGNWRTAIELYEEFSADTEMPRLRREVATLRANELQTALESSANQDELEPMEGIDGELLESTHGGHITGSAADTSTSARARLSPTAFYSSLGAVAATGIATAVLGAFALNYDDQYDEAVARCQREEAAELREDGQRLAIATDVMLGLTIASALTAVIIAVFTRWSGRARSRSQSALNIRARVAAPALGFLGSY